MNTQSPIIRAGILPLLGLLSACSSAPEVKTLGSIDLVGGSRSDSAVFVKPKSEEEVKAAYYEYISSAAGSESSRLAAINRLAEMEINRLNELVKTSEQLSLDDELYRNSLLRTRSLLETSLADFPDAEGNDEILYQLARTSEQLGDADASLDALRQLSQRYPQSRHYAEARFRLGEAAFVMGDYISAEDSYSEAIFADSPNTLYERALFKRGWSRYKQGLYIEAADDYLAALKSRRFGDYLQLQGSDKDEIDEYFRAIGLAFANLQDFSILQNFFVSDDDRQYLYHIYRVIADTYLEQERYSDAASVLEQYVSLNGTAEDVPLAHLKIVEAWRLAGFRNRFQPALEALYQQYHASHSYWNRPSASESSASIKKLVIDSIGDYCLEMAVYHHGRYSASRDRNAEEFEKADSWYQRYLRDYSAFAQQDKVYKRYAELLSARGDNAAALPYFELAAWDGEIVLDKEAAYATIVLASELYEADKNKSEWLDRQIRYALTSLRLYPNEERYHKAALNAAESAHQAKRYQDSLALLQALPDRVDPTIAYKAGVLQGLGYRESGLLAEAEAQFAELLQHNLDRAQRREQSDNLALVIYRQGEQAQAAGDVASAIADFARVSEAARQSEIAPRALYDAIILSMNNEFWAEAIHYAEQFQSRYPDHELNKDATRQVSAAYLKAGDEAKAARAFEQLANEDGDREVKMAALWQAAALYESRNEIEAAIRSYRSYAHSFPQPYPQYMEAMYKLASLYEKTGEADKRLFWQERIVKAEQGTAKSRKNERSNYIAAHVLLDLARSKAREFQARKLVLPLADNLRIKKQLLQESTQLYGRASVYGMAEVTAEATYAIGRIYQDFSRALLDSERPPALTGEELIQYNILLEDQAFPFEEKAIEFYETNLSRVREGLSNRWIIDSYKQLAALFPARYNRKGKVDIYVDQS